MTYSLESTIAEKFGVILLDIKRYMDEKILDDREKARKYPMILLNLSTWFCNNRQYEEALQYTNEGITCCRRYKKLQDLPELFATKGTILGNLSQIGEARECFVQAWHLFDMLEKFYFNTNTEKVHVV